MKIAENLSLRMYPEEKEIYSDGKAPIYVKVTVTGSKPKEFSTGMKIDPHAWNPNSWRVDGTKPDILAINNRLTQVRAKLEKHYLLLSMEYEVITAELLVDAYKGKFDKKSKNLNRTLCQAFNFKYSLFACQVKAGIRSVSTFRKWRTTKRKIRDCHTKFLRHW